MFNNKLKEENIRLKYRIKELEEKLCPCESHAWKLIGTDYKFGCCVEDIDIIYHYRCVRCGKEMREVGA
jgi:hypothetical protein